MMCCLISSSAYSNCIFFFFNDTATTEIYTLSLHDALPIWLAHVQDPLPARSADQERGEGVADAPLSEEEQQRRRRAIAELMRSEEHTSELQSRQYLVCRLLLEKKQKSRIRHIGPESHLPIG